MQIHLQIRQPHRGHTKDDHIGDEICYFGSNPASTWRRTFTEAGRPCRWYRRAVGKIVYYGANEKAANNSMCNPLDDPSVLFAGPRYEDAAVENDEGEF